MKRLFLSLILSLFCFQQATAIIFARNVWVHPATGDRVEIMFCIHNFVFDELDQRELSLSNNVDEVIRQQKQDVIDYAKQDPNTVVLVEDPVRAVLNHKHVPAAMKFVNYALKINDILFLGEELEKNNIPFINIENRLHNLIPGITKAPAAHYDDVPLNTFYKQVKQFTEIVDAWMVDSKLAHEVYQLCNNAAHRKTIMPEYTKGPLKLLVVAGAGHGMVHRIALHCLGFKCVKTDVNSALATIIKNPQSDIERSIKKHSNHTIFGMTWNDVQSMMETPAVDDTWIGAFQATNPLNLREVIKQEQQNPIDLRAIIEQEQQQEKEKQAKKAAAQKLQNPVVRKVNALFGKLRSKL